MELSGSSAVVTGGASGIGAALVTGLARRGVRGVLVADLDGEGAGQVASEATALGVQALGRQVDVADPDAVAAMISAAEGVFGGLDLVVSNAGIGAGAGLDADPEQWQRSWEVNVLAHVHAARAALPGMLERGRGAFLHTCSAAGLLTMVGDAPYSVTKHGAVAFAEWLAVTYGDLGIEVVALCPQGVETPLLAEADTGLAGRVVRAAAPVLTADEVATSALSALEEGRFLALPHPEVAQHEQAKAADRDRWLAALRRITRALGG